MTGMTTGRAAIYARISRDREGAGLGVDRQEADCRELAARHGWTVVSVYRDNDLSAYSGKPRPGYRVLLDQVSAGAVDVVVAWHTDRLHRSPVELEEYITVCEARGVPTMTVKAGPLDLATPSGRLVARQLGAVARYEVEHAIERQKRAKLQAATDGRYRGSRRPYGYEKDGVTVRPHEAAIVRELSDRCLAGASMHGLAAELNGRHETTSTGGMWRDDAVRNVLLRARNAGLVEHNGEIVGAALWPAIVSEDTWRAVRAVLLDPVRSRPQAPRRWVGSGLYLCGLCDDGTTVTSCQSTRGRAGTRPAYTCRNSRHVVRSCRDVDEYVAEFAVARLGRDDAADLLMADGATDTAELHTQALALRGRLDELASAFADGDIDARQMREGSERARSRLTAIEDQIAEAARGSALDGLIGIDLAGWTALDLDRQRAALDTLMVVRLLPSGKGRPAGWRPGTSYFRPETIDVQPRR